MVPHAAPSPAFDYDLDTERAALRAWRDTKPGRQIPARTNDRLVVATWNLTNLGLQNRRPDDYRLMAEILSWFDLAAVQEIGDDLRGLRAILEALPGYRALVSDPGGNHERLGFLYDPAKVELLELVGEVAVPPADHRHIRLRNVSGAFTGFDRNPYLAAFLSGGFSFVAVSVHLYFGGTSWRHVDRRSLEAYAVARWADLRHGSDFAYDHNIIVLGDFNLPKRDPGDGVFRALTRRGLSLPEHGTQLGSNLASDCDYDQIAFFPGPAAQRLEGSGVFDFDGAVFRDAWQNRRPDFQSIVKFYLADHRPLWSAFRV